MTKGSWAPVNRAKGESAERWLARAHDAHRGAWRREKIARGEWVPAEEYARVRGRPGARMTALEEVRAAEGRAARSARVTGPAAAKKSAAANAGTSDARLADHASGAAMSGAFAAAVAIVGEVFEHGRKVNVKATAAKAAREGASATVRSAATTLVKEGVEMAAKDIAKRSGRVIVQKAVSATVARQGAALAGKALAKSVLRANAAGAVAGAVVEQAIGTVSLVRGKIDAAEYGRRSAENVASSATGLGGAALGAVIGTAVCPGIGTAIGSFVGGLMGSIAGQYGVKRALR